MSNDIKKIESVENGVNLVLDDDRVITVTTVSSTDTEELGNYTLSESEEDETKVKAEGVDDLIKEIEDKYDVDFSEDEKEELKEALETDSEKLDPLKESDEDEAKTEDDDEEVKAESEDDEAKTEDEDEEKKPVSEKKKRKSESEEDETFKLSEELDDLLEVELDSTVKEKIDVAFDTLVKEKVKKIKEELDKENEIELKESISKLQESVSTYITQAAKQYISENKLALTEGLRKKYFESFFGKLRKLFKENYIDLDEKEEELVDELKKENEELKESTDKLVTQVKSLNESILILKRKQEITKLASDMYLTESERFNAATKQLLKESNKLTEEKFTQKLKAIAEMFKSGKQKKTTATTKILSEGSPKVVTESKKEVHPDVSRLLENW